MMSNALTFFSEDDRRRIEAAIADAEKKTSAEIVCAVATESGRYDRAESVAGLLGGLLVLGVANLFHSAYGVGDAGSWSGGGGAFSYGWQCLFIVAGFVGGSLLASYCHPLRRLLTSEKEMAAEAERGAHHVFSAQGLRRTAGRGGLLIYVSLFERKVVIFADDGVNEAAGDDLTARLRDIAVGALREGRRVETFTETIDAAVETLAPRLPVAEDDRDELLNELVLIHPRP